MFAGRTKKKGRNISIDTASTRRTEKSVVELSDGPRNETITDLRFGAGLATR